MLIEAYASMPIWLTKHAPSALFIFAFGACVGSFMNVVVFRLPAGISVISPPSRCPTCGAKLTFFRDNLPIIGWLLLGGTCRYCGVRISVRYMIVELSFALVALGIYGLLYAVRPGDGWLGAVGNDWWYFNHFMLTWPACLLLIMLIAALYAMTVIDAKTFTIPMQIPNFIVVAAFLLWPLQAMLPLRRLPTDWPIPGVDPVWAGAAIFGLLGILIANALLQMKVLRYSFADYYDYVDPEEAVGDYPHARREMLRELAFLAPILTGVVLGAFLGPMLFGEVVPDLVQAFAASVLGYLVGGGLVWGIRLFGTLAFGREAMGLGDVHLLGAIGAVLGWYEPILIFFVAPFSGIVWHVVTMVIAWVRRSSTRNELPYGPHLAVATIIVILGRPWFDALLATLMNIAPPTPGFIGAG